MPPREYQSLLAMMRSIIERMDYEDCEKCARVVDTNIDNALWWVDPDDEAIDLADAVADACHKLAKPLSKGVLSPGQIAAGKQDILGEVDRFEQHLQQLPPSPKAEALAKVEATFHPRSVQ